MYLIDPLCRNEKVAISGKKKRKELILTATESVVQTLLFDGRSTAIFAPEGPI